MARFGCICALLFLGGAIFVRCQTWSTIRPGLEVMADGVLTEKGRSIKFVLLRCDPKLRQVRIVDTYHEVGSKLSYPAFSLAEVTSLTGAVVTLSAGDSSSYVLPDPVGLLQSARKVLAKPNYRAENAGFLCLSPGAATLAPLNQWKAASCVDAVQRGPFFTSSFRSTTDSHTDQSERGIVALDAKGRLVIMITEGPVTISTAATYLFSSKAGLEIRSALNLVGSRTCGLLVTNSPGKSKQSESALAVGNVDGLVASAIAIY